MNAKELREQYGREQVERMNQGLLIIIWPDWLESRLAEREKSLAEAYEAILQTYDHWDTEDGNWYCLPCEVDANDDGSFSHKLDCIVLKASKQ